MTPSNTSLPPRRNTEEEILLLCARTRMSAGKTERIRALLEGPLDWQALIDAAASHGVTPLLSHCLLTLCPGSVSAEWRTKLQNELESIKRRNLFLAAEMLRLAGRFQAEGLLAIPYKGPLLASQAYGDLGLRQFADLDFAIRQRDISRAHALLIANGFEAVFGTVSPDEGSRPTRSEYQFIRPKGRIIVEMQTESTLRYFPRPLNFDSLAARMTKFSLGGAETLSFSPEDTFILLAVHGTKHFWQRLMWIVDISELAQLPGNIQWPKLLDRAGEMDVARMVNLALYVAAHLLGAPIPDEAMRRVKADAKAVKLGDEVCARFHLVPDDPPVFRRFWFRAASRGNFWQGLRYAMRIATSPTDPDRSDLPLPSKLSRLRGLVRPLLLTKRYGIRRSKPRETP